MKWSVVTLLTILLGCYGLINYFVGLRGWQYFFNYIPGSNRMIYWILFGVVSLSCIFRQVGEKYFSTYVNLMLTWIGSYWLGILFYALLIFGTLDLASLIMKGSISRAFRMGLGVMLLILLLQVVGTYLAWQPVVKQYELTIAKSGGSLSELRLVLVSDVHLDKIVDGQRLNKMVEIINEREPDLVVFAGDIVDSSADVMAEEKLIDALKKLAPLYGTYAVLGNHEYIHGAVAQVMEHFRQGGARVLRDEVVHIADSFYLIGRDDRSKERFYGVPRQSLGDLMSGVDKHAPVLLLDHRPDRLTEAEQMGVDLQLSGHTHGGQLFPVNLITSGIFETDGGYLKKGLYR